MKTFLELHADYMAALKQEIPAWELRVLWVELRAASIRDGYTLNPDATFTKRADSGYGLCDIAAALVVVFTLLATIASIPALSPFL